MEATVVLPPATRNRVPGSRLLIPGFGVALLVLFSVLYTTDTPLYTRILTWAMGRPFPHPFLDWEWFPSAVECWQRGVDVYVDNTCYQPIAHGRHIYSPLWLRMTFLPYGERWVVPFGLGIGAVFFASLAALPPQRRAAGFCVIFLATFSSFTAFAIERANADLIIFVLTVAGVICWTGRLRWRLVGYGIFILAGLLKFYPFVLLILALRERPRVFTGICAATLVVLSASGLAFHDELGRIDGIPGGQYFGDRFASDKLPYGLSIIGTGLARSLGDKFGWTFHDALQMVSGPAVMLLPERASVILLEARQRWEQVPDWQQLPLFTLYLPRGLLLTLTLATILRAARLSRRLRLDTRLAAMPKPEAGLLVAGAVMICACFFAGQSNGYRAVMMLLALPGLLWLARSMNDRAARVELMATCWAIVFIMWVIAIQQVLSSFGGGATILFEHWLINEVAWWWVVSVLLAVLIGFVCGSRLGLQTQSFLPTLRVAIPAHYPPWRTDVSPGRTPRNSPLP